MYQEQEDAGEAATPSSVVTSPRIPAGTWEVDTAHTSAEGSSAETEGKAADEQPFEEVRRSKRINSKREEALSAGTKTERVLVVPRRAVNRASATTTGSSAVIANRPSAGRVLEVPRPAAPGSRGTGKKSNTQHRH